VYSACCIHLHLVVPCSCVHSVSPHVGMFSLFSPFKHTSLPTPLSPLLRTFLRLVHDNKLMLIFAQGIAPSKTACVVYASIPMYRPRTCPRHTKHHRPSYLSSPMLYHDKTRYLSDTITVLVSSPRASSSTPSAFSPQEHCGAARRTVSGRDAE
jgi:hypothetical protein